MRRRWFLAGLLAALASPALAQLFSPDAPTLGARNGLITGGGVYSGRTDVVVAYSVRRLRDSYVGPLVRVRRSSDSTEQDFGGGQTWVSWPEVLAFIGAGSGFVSKWYDQSGNARDLAQATNVTWQPAITLLANGRPGLLFDGVNDYLRAPAFTLPQPWSFNINYRRVSSKQVDYENVFDGITGDRGTLYMRNAVASSNSMYASQTFDGDIGSVAVPMGVRAAVGGTFNSTSAIMELNGATIASLTGNTGANVMDGLTLGTMGALAPSRFSNIEVQELVFFNVGHTSPQLQSDNAASRAAFGPDGNFTGRVDIAGAYSMRRARSEYAGPLVRVRRSTDNVEQDFGAGQAAVSWAEVATFIGAGSGFCPAWYDQSGNARHLLQATAANQPQLSLLDDGLPGLVFNGTTHRMKTAPYALAQPYSLNIVFKWLSIPAAGVEGHVVSGNADNQHGDLFCFGSPTRTGYYAGVTLANGLGLLPAGQRAALGVAATGAASLLEVNGATIASYAGDAGVAPRDGLTVGNSGAGTSPANVEMQALLLFSTAHTSPLLKADNALLRTLF